MLVFFFFPKNARARVITRIKRPKAEIISYTMSKIEHKRLDESS